MRNVTITSSYMTFTSPISITTGVCYSIPTGAGMAWCSAYISARNIKLWQQQYNQATNWTKLYCYDLFYRNKFFFSRTIICN